MCKYKAVGLIFKFEDNMYNMKFVDGLFPDTYYNLNFPYIAAVSMGRSVRMMYLMFCLSFARESIPWPLCLARKKRKEHGGWGWH